MYHSTYLYLFSSYQDTIQVYRISISALRQTYLWSFKAIYWMGDKSQAESLLLLLKRLKNLVPKLLGKKWVVTQVVIQVLSTKFSKIIEQSIRKVHMTSCLWLSPKFSKATPTKMVSIWDKKFLFTITMKLGEKEREQSI